VSRVVLNLRQEVCIVIEDHCVAHQSCTDQVITSSSPYIIIHSSIPPNIQHGWIDGWMDGWREGCVVGWIDSCVGMYVQMDGCVD